MMDGSISQPAGPPIDVCPICGSGEIAHAFTAQDLNWKTPGTFAYERCRNCGVLFRQTGSVNPTASYPFGYGSYPDPKAASLLSYIDTAANRRRAMLLESICPSGTILDVGCGSGFFLAHMRSRGWRVHGIDMAEEHVAYAKNVLGLPDVSLDVWPSGSNVFRDLAAVSMIHLIEHLTDPVQVLAAACNALREGGAVLLETPNIDSWPARLFGSRWVTLDAPRHMILFNTKSLSSCLRRAGFEDIRMVSYSPSTMEWSESLRYVFRQTRRTGQSYIPSTTIAPSDSVMYKQGDGEVKRRLKNLIHAAERVTYRFFNTFADSMSYGCNVLAIAVKGRRLH